MSVEDRFKLLIGAYYGVRAMDEYELKVYVLKDIEEVIRKFVNKENISNSKYLVKEVEKSVSLKGKLQDALIIINELDNYEELSYLIKLRIRKLEKEQ